MKYSGTAIFWKSRVKLNGHSGWADPIIYAFDQRERLYLVAHTVAGLAAPQLLALDFGCGSGDFARLLLQKGFEVYGYDPFVLPTVRANGFTYISEHERFASLTTGDLALTVTVLDHILDPVDFVRALTVIQSFLKPSGRAIFVEYALDDTADRDRFCMNNEYQAFRTLTEWKKALDASGLSVLNVTPVAHPSISPSPGYLAYRRCLVVRLMAKLPRRWLLTPLSTALLKWRASRYLAVYRPARSPLKLIECFSRQAD